MASVGTPPAPVTPQVTVDILEADAVTLVSALDMTSVVDGTVEDPLQGDGLGQIVVGLESANRAQLEVKGRVLGWNVDGAARFYSVVEANEQVTLPPGHDPAGPRITVKGRGLHSQWEAPRVQQWPGMQQVPYYTRHVNYASPGKAASIDGAVSDHAPVLWFDAFGQPVNPQQPPPASWRDPGARRIWSAPYSGSQRTGVSLFRKRITTGTSHLVFRWHGTGDDRVLGWCGGVPILKCPDYPTVIWGNTYASTTLLQATSTYDLVARAENEPSTPPFSVAWLGMAGWLLISDGDGIDSTTLACHTDTSWTCLECIDIPTPGWIVPEILATFLAEWQTENFLTGWQVVDMTPSAWSPILEKNWPTKTTSGLAVLNSFDGQGEFAVAVQGGVKKLLCFAPGMMGDFANATPPEFTNVEILDLTHEWVQS
jgi:hypothetical protein